MHACTYRMQGVLSLCPTRLHPNMKATSQAPKLGPFTRAVGVNATRRVGGSKVSRELGPGPAVPHQSSCPHQPALRPFVLQRMLPAGAALRCRRCVAQLLMSQRFCGAPWLALLLLHALLACTFRS